MCHKLSIVTCNLIKNSPFLHTFFPDGSILVANKRCQNLKDLLVYGNPYNIKHDLTDIVPHQCKPCGEKCDSCDNFFVSQSYVTIKVISRRMFVLPRLQHILLMDVVMRKYLSSVYYWSL